MPWVNDTVNATTIATLDALERAALLLGQAGDDDALFDTVLTGIRQATGADRVVLYLVDPVEGDLLELASLDEAAFSSTDDFGVPPTKVVEKTLVEGRAQIEEVVKGLLPALVLPLLSGGNVTGLIYADQLSFVVSDEDLLALQALANLAAAALERGDLLAGLEELEKAQREFVSLTTHQLRVPLTSISGYADLLLRGIPGSLTERQEQFLQTIRRNVDRMGALIGDLSDLNRLSDGRMHFSPSEVDLRKMVDVSLQEKSEAIAAQGHDVQLHMPHLLPPAYGHQPAIKRAFDRILDNAIIYTPLGGRVVISGLRHGDMVQITITDTGIGISAEDQARLFKPFFRSEDEAVREQAGWGLSLALAKALIEAHGGQIWCESESRVGSAFHIALPVAGTDQGRATSDR